MAIGTPQDLGFTAPTTTGNSLNLPITHNAAAGSFIGVFVLIGPARTFATFADSKGNSYTSDLVGGIGGVGLLWFFYSPNPATPLTVGGGDSFTVTWTGSADAPNMSAFQITGLVTSSPLDVTGTVASGSGTTTTITSGVLAQANEIVLSVLTTAGTAGGYTHDAAFTPLSANQQTGGDLLAIDSLIVSSTSSVNSAPSWGTSRTFAGLAFSLKGAAAPAGGNNGLLLGVG